MKTALILVSVTLLLAACKDNPGKHLGVFQQQCEAQNGKVTQLAPSKYKCTLPDGAEYESK